MKYMGLNEIREKFLRFFESKGHLAVKSYPLVPQGDKSLLLINAGMAPLKKFFTGESDPPAKRLTDCQKCIRTNDIERVGVTARHGSFFEMLGNFSFGDYFKAEAIGWAWEFLTAVLELPADRLWATVYLDDAEAISLWKAAGMREDHIVRLGKEDNFWEIGSGPCGPCSEIHFDRGEEFGCGSPDCRPGCDCDRFLEIWNLVFTQFNGDGEGGYTPLSHPNIDTGMGLERISCLMQGAGNLFEVDTVRSILDRVCEMTGTPYGKDGKKDVSIRVITDHIRSTVFLICDGVMPSNEGRGYVLRRLLRRAYRHGRLLGVKGLFLSGLAEKVIENSRSAYPELGEKADYIKKIISMEEEKFASTLEGGLALLNKVMDQQTGKVIPGEEVFRLSDTYGFPFDITREIAAERGFTLDEAGFAACMNEQKERARAARKDAGAAGWEGKGPDVLADLPQTVFTGYDTLACDCRILALLDGRTGELSDGECEGNVTLVLDKTPFYGESGGQVGDRGIIGNEKFAVRVENVKRKNGVFLHSGKVLRGFVSPGEAVRAEVDAPRRAAICRAHSAAHLLHAALRRVLGDHVAQAGSYVDDKRTRFDFSHFSAVSAEEIERVEDLVNEAILKGIPVETVETDPESAKKAGATALFGEKYGETVRMVGMGDVSTELCGGTHVKNTAQIGLFKIVSESSVASGVRRIEAVTGENLLDYLKEKEKLISGASAVLKAANPSDLIKKAESVEAELKEAKAKIEELTGEIASMRTSGLYASAVPCGKVKLAFLKSEDMDVGTARKACDSLRDRYPDLVAVIAALSGGKINFVCSCGKEAVESGANAGKICKALGEMTGGNGGGRPDSAVSGGKDASKLDGALSALPGILSGMLS